MVHLYFWGENGILVKEGETINEQKVKEKLDTIIGDIVLVQSIKHGHIDEKEFPLPTISHGPFKWFNPQEYLEEDKESKLAFTTSPYLANAGNWADLYLSFKRKTLKRECKGIARIVDGHQKTIYEDTTLVKLWEEAYSDLKNYTKRMEKTQRDYGSEKYFFRGFKESCLNRRELLEVYAVAHMGEFRKPIEYLLAQDVKSKKTN